MCTEIYFRHEQEMVTSPRELLKFIPRDALVVGVDYPPIEEIIDQCLCPVNVEATFESIPDYVLTNDGITWIADKAGN